MFTNVDLFFYCSGLSSGRGFGPAASVLACGRASELHADDQLVRRYRGTVDCYE